MNDKKSEAVTRFSSSYISRKFGILEAEIIRIILKNNIPHIRQGNTFFVDAKLLKPFIRLRVKRFS